MRNPRLFRILGLVLVFALSACQASDADKPAWDQDDFSARLEQTEIPYDSFSISNGRITVVMNYGVESSAPEEIRYTSDVIQIMDLMCKYQYDFGVKVEYSDKAFTTVDKETLQAYCEKSITLDQVKSNLFWRY